MLTVLGKATSINVRKVLWTCHELSLPFEQQSWGAGFRPTDSPAFLAMNPNAMVPVIRDGDFVLWESNSICRYLASQYGGATLYPAAPRARAMVDQWVDWQATELNNAWRYAFMALVRESAAHQGPAAIGASVASWNRHMAMVDARLARTGAFMAGDTFTLADIVIGLSANRWQMTPIERPDLPALAAYLQRLNERPGFALYGNNGVA
ncbi:glutathione S-transferase [Massilia sp. PAMC28688]|uniref:glutathione S-transferase family protein n=1 Tax=Massilia sp. PAMC28688 TaxID=2861283 RepID=UPI001C63A281|nr:glutathione S-transferase [Massilia sp. PAMC28688]QYF94576.1 glutathione S-transferase [Massilia sp. PAMC28688]